MTDEITFFMRQDISAFQINALYPFHIHLTRLGNAGDFKDLGHGIGTGKSHLIILPDGGRAADSLKPITPSPILRVARLAVSISGIG